jgi:signal transduction histidine kinase
VITNLVKNSTQAINQIEPEEPRIDVNISELDTEVVITVSDNGIGIEPENADKIFEPKFTTKNSGMGLGLAMVKTIVENYKGTISSTSQPGMATTFTVRIPRQL